MPRPTTTLRLTVSLGLVLGFCAATAGVLPEASVLAAPEQAADPVAEWDTQWERAIKDSATDYRKLAEAFDKKLEATAAYTRRYILRYTPDDEEIRKFLGYAKAVQSDGTTKWERVDTRRDQINEMSDLDDPKATKYGKNLVDVNKKVVNRFKGLAKKATDNGAAKDASAAAKWPERAARAWEKVLELDDGTKDFDEAHKALNHPKFEGKYCSPLKFKYVKARADRKKLGEKEATAQIKPVDPVDPDGAFVAAGLTGGGAKSAHIVINCSYGKDVAMRLCGSVEKALNDLQEVYGYPETFKERLGLTKINAIKDVEEFKKLMDKGFGWKQAKITKYVDAGLTGVSDETGKGERIQPSSGGQQDADDACMAVICSAASRAAQSLARADVGSSSRDDVEDWLWESIGYDVTKRVNGTANTIWGAFGRYGQAVEARPGEDKWVELARRLAESDDDVPLRLLYKKTIENKEIKGPETVKGWAFIQFIFEKDPERAKKFVWNALAAGTPTAAAAVYPDNEDSPDPEKSMEKLDTEYREWIRKAW